MSKPLHKALAISVVTLSAFSVGLFSQTFSDWTPPVNLTTINTSSFEG